jgi:alkylation response protein AidB-like acyl-CoA dehydrogenase
MDFRLTPEQLELQDHVRRYCARVFTLEGLAALDQRGPDRGTWVALADLGLFGLRVPEADGGLGLGWVEAVAAYEVLGAHLVPGPLVWSQLLAGVAPGVADGSRIVTGVDHVDPGAPLIVEHLGLADAVAVVTGEGVVLVDVTADSASGADGSLTPLDPLTPVGRFTGPVEGERVLGAGEVDRIRAEGAVLTGALLVGIADRALEVAREYALGREQFGRPIAAFQAVQHLLADMYVRTMLARSAAYAAAAILDDATAGDLAAAVGSVKVVAGDAAMANARTCIQVHGGMGFTWEMMPHYLLKRTWVLEHGFGTSVEHAEALAAAMGSTG